LVRTARQGPEKGSGQLVDLYVELGPEKGQKWLVWEVSYECVHVPTSPPCRERCLHVELGWKVDVVTGTGGQRGQWAGCA